MHMQNQSGRAVILVIFLILAIVASIDPNLAIFAAIIIGVIWIRKFGLLEYVGCCLVLLGKSQSEIVLSSTDLASNAINYKLIATGKLVMTDFHWGEYERGEIILPSIYWVISRLFPEINASVLSFIFLLSFLIIFYFIIRYLDFKPTILVFFVLLLDVNLIIHLFRQTIASSILLLGLMPWLVNRKLTVMSANKYGQVVLSFFMHLTSIIFLPLLFLFNKTPLMLLKLIAVAAAYFAFAYDGKTIFQEFINSSHGLPILGKMSYALVVFESDGGIRPVALIAISLCLFIKDNIPLVKIFLGFSALMLIFYDIPILSTRVGFIGTSILTGLPIGIVVMKVRDYTTRKNKPRISMIEINA